MTVSEAWLLQPENSPLIAISDHQIVEYIQAPVVFAVPGAPKYCNSVVLWQSNPVPVMDIGGVLGFPESDGSSLMNLIAFQEQPGQPLQYVAIKVKIAPQKIQVDDALTCELPEEIRESVLSKICLSCFSNENRPVVILDIARLCSAEFRDLVNPPLHLISPYLKTDKVEVT